MNVILIDDEQLALNYLEYQLLEITDFHIIGKYTDSLDAIAAIEKNGVDIIFLDIHMPEIDGIELAEQLLEKKPHLKIIFVTAFDDYAVKAFELNALDYVLKPVSKERLLNTIKRIEQTDSSSSILLPEMEKLNVSMFQQVSISYDQQQRMPLRFRTTKIQQLFIYMLHRRGHVIEKHELIDLIWPDLEPKKALSQLYTAIYNLRKTLAPFERHFHITNTLDGYVMTFEDLLIDVDEFERLIRSGDSLSHETIADYEQAVNLYKGEYLQDYDYFWIINERQRLQFLWTRTALSMVKWYLSNNQLDQAIELGSAICHRSPLEEESYFLLMKIFAKMEKGLLVNQVYEQLEKVMKEELNEKPIPSITEWYKQWKVKNKE
ncbi:two-component SAPR family response regulator [Cytobacillus eiseniae]|uniref:Two-component SAPR family response regulator n=1 Tax=Cytobacillus eiseniae TaxID=762947 RepID=A0ABS4RFU7_9BACI|nr:response regulator [Cytobacillus eiseniae]MBP2241579.1 two-component SAPR family response regulator [Cytobacillus eiseniae]